MLFLDLKWQFKLVYERKASSASFSKLILDQNRGFFLFNFFLKVAFKVFALGIFKMIISNGA